MAGKKPSVKLEAARKKRKMLEFLEKQERLTKQTNNQKNPVKLQTNPGQVNGGNSSDQSKALNSGNGVTVNPSNNPDYVEFEDLKPEYQELVEKFIMTDRVYMRQLREEEEQDNDNSNTAVDKQVEEPVEETKKKPKLSKKKLKQLKRIPVAQLKVLVDRPDLVESWDVTAKDPLLLMWLKSYKNTVVVPKHWSQKRKFLQNKRGK